MVKEDLITILASSPAPMPVIRSFSCDEHFLSTGGVLTLSWVVDHTDVVMICRNDLPHVEVEKDARSITLRERFDGKKRKVSYSIVAVNDKGHTASGMLHVHIGLDKPPGLLAISIGIYSLVLLVLLAFGISQ